MANLFSSVARHPATWMIAGTGLALGGAMLLQRYRNANATPGPRETSGHWIGSAPVLPSHIPSSASHTERTALSSYLTDTHMNMQHPDMATVQKRATAFQHWKGAEESILNKTQKALSDFTTPHFALSSEMVHNERRVLSDRAQELRSTQPETAATTLSREVERMTGVRSQGSGPSYTSLTDMLIHGKKGPLTIEQSALGVEATIVGHHVLDKTPKYDKSNPRMQAERPTDPLTGKPSHPTTSPHGMDLSIDPGTKLRESLGLPVMTGTSGSASDVVRSHGFTLKELQAKMPEASFMQAADHSQTMQELTFNWMRRGAPMSGVRGLIGENQSANNFKKISTPGPTATQTHTFPEIAAGVDLTIHGNTPDHLRNSTMKAMKVMESHRS